MSLGKSLRLTGSFLFRYFLVRDTGGGAEPLLTVADAADVEPLTTGPSLIDSIYETIGLRRSVLVTGPRGCGKSYCSEQGIVRARDKGVIGGWRLLQGNREVPRETLS